MFVKSLPKWKIKRFFKRVLKAFIFFSLLFSLSFSSFAISNFEYFDFESFVGNGTVEWLLRNQSSNIVRSGEFTSDSHNLNDMTLAYNYSQSFTSVRLNIIDSDNVKTSFKSNDLVILRHAITVHMSGAQVSSTYADLFTIVITCYNPETYSYSSVEVRGDDALSWHTYSNESWGSSVRYEVDVNQSLPSFDGEITSISYHFYNISPESYSFRIYPSQNGGTVTPITYYIGSKSNAPLYPEYDTSTPDLDDAFDEFDKADADATEIFNNSNDSFFNFIDSAIDGIGTFLYPIITSVSSIITFVLTSLPEPIQHLFAFALILGMLAFVMGLINTVISRWRSS